MIILIDDYIYQYKKVIDNLRYAQGSPSQFGISIMNDMILGDLYKEDLNNYQESNLIEAMEVYVDYINNLYSEFIKMKQGIIDYIGSSNKLVDKTTGEYFAISIHLATSLAGLKFLSDKALELYEFKLENLNNSFVINEKCKDIRNILDELYTVVSNHQIKTNDIDDRPVTRITKNSNKQNEQHQIRKEVDRESILKNVGFFVIILLLIAIMDLPYGYYIFLRIFVFAYAAIMSIFNYSKNKESNEWWLTIPLAILFNPVIPIHLTKSIWIFLNLISAALIGYISYHLDKSIEHE